VVPFEPAVGLWGRAVSGSLMPSAGTWN
jgi:hypothetical protein